MTIEQAVQLMEQGLNLAAKAGTFNLKDSKTLQEALDSIKNYVNVNEATKNQNKSLEMEPIAKDSKSKK